MMTYCLLLESHAGHADVGAVPIAPPLPHALQALLNGMNV